MEINVTGNDSGAPEFNGTLSRVNIILGPNGTGKTKLLQSIPNSLASNADYRVVVLSHIWRISRYYFWGAAAECRLNAIDCID